MEIAKYHREQEIQKAKRSRTAKRILTKQQNKKPKPPKRKPQIKKLIPVCKLRSVPNSFFKSYKDYCKSIYFKSLKEEVLNKYKNTCTVCKKDANTAHHKKYRERWSDSQVKDCIAVCNKCHYKIHIELDKK